ncbi:MAG TPA: phosphate acyltransferase PlsX [Candidatus Cloacimonadota bacterium]|nr:phosphate acyltransferase PlsX [Candidatus Cloacimonadota bacterium]HOQ79770.1 phosphate acyltransferase PlsX [Candidatus Cloacimonadota bacterium]HPY95983.1 phosphate acyltransferase PlsX [Candidatus Cloacimonadota bacterium]HQB40589.1 phosphate acyltransferase PlsX [Candidatus Cloacimonadota bacterium]
MKISLDAYGSDNCPLAEVEGAVLAIKENVCEKIYLVGKEDELASHLDKFIYDKSRIEIVHAPDVISMDDDPSVSARKKTDSSMVVALRLHKEGKADAAVSAGNTGAMMAASLFALGRIKNVSRPAIALTFPTMHGQEIVLDVGANVDCESQHLEQFAVLGSLYAKFSFNLESPTVSLLNIGEESKKGNELTKTAYQALSQNKEINFIGNIEGKDLLKGVTDVVVCDGFVGNVMLKSVEGAAMAIFDMMKEQMKHDWVAKIGALLSYPVYKYLKKKLDHSEYGGALLVGLNGISVVAHGRSNAIAIKNAVKFAAKISESAFIEEVKEYFERK